MHAKSSTRLRLECLERRSLLSAIALPLVPPVTTLLAPAVAGEFARIGGQHFATAVALETPQNSVTTLHANPVPAPDQLSAGPIQPSDVPSISGSQFSDPVSAHDLLRSGDVVNATSFMPDARSSGPNGVADSGNWRATQGLSGMSGAANLDAMNLQRGGLAGGNAIDTRITPPSPGTPKDNLRFSFGATGQRSESIILTIRESPLRFQGEVVTDVLVAVDPAISPPGMSGVQSIESPPPDLGPADFASAALRVLASRPADQAVVVGAPSDVSSIAESSPSFTRAHTPDMIAANAGSQASSAAEAVASIPNSLPNSSASNAAFSDPAAANSLEDGFIILEASATTTRVSKAISYNTGLQGVKGAELDGSNWLSDVLGNKVQPADIATGNTSVAGSLATLAARSSSVISQPIADLEEGGSIELAIAAPSPTMAGESMPAGESPLGDAAQQLSEIRRENGIVLFCDIEVAVAPFVPIGTGSSAATTSQIAPHFVAHAGIHGSKAETATESVSPSSKLWQPTLAGLADRLPLLLGATVLVSRGGLRLEEKVSQRDARLYSIEYLRRSPGQ